MWTYWIRSLEFPEFMILRNIETYSVRIQGGDEKPCPKIDTLGLLLFYSVIKKIFFSLTNAL